jgi:hypothetical protein
MNHDADGQAGQHHRRVHHIGQDVAENHPGSRGAGDLGQLDELAFAEAQHLTADDAGVAGPENEPPNDEMFHMLGPTIVARKMAKTKLGRASHASVIRMITWSTQPPNEETDTAEYGILS